MYFGSVNFFKHVIVATILIFIIGLAITAKYLFVLNIDYRNQISNLKSGAVLAQSYKQENYTQQSVSIDYQKLYPVMVANLAETSRIESKTVYLTFDDGPSDRTLQILDILKEKNVKATFFIIGKDGEKEKAIMRRIVDEGHTIGIHSYSHIYDNIYESVDNYLTDFNKIYNLIYITTGVKPEVFRFPGGSINIYNTTTHKEISAEMTRRGFTYYDWNASSGDADNRATKNSVLANSIKSSSDKDRVILLMHDSVNKDKTVAALPDIIEHFKAKGFKFDKITNDVRPVAFNYNNY